MYRYIYISIHVRYLCCLLVYICIQLFYVVTSGPLMGALLFPVGGVLAGFFKLWSGRPDTQCFDGSTTVLCADGLGVRIYNARLVSTFRCR